MNNRISNKDKKDWEDFISKNEKLPDKDFKLDKKKVSKIKHIDLHGFSLDEANKTIKKFIDENGVPDLLINNAGSGAFYKWDEFPIEEIERQINLLFTVPVLFCRKIAPLMAKQEKGIIVKET